MSTNPNRKKSKTRPMTAPLPPGKKGTTGRLKAGGKGKKKKKKGTGLMAQLIAGITLTAAIGGVAAAGIYLAEQAANKQAEKPVNPLAVPRPKFSPTLDGLEPNRPGWAASPEDEVYERKATDVATTPYEPPVQGLLLKEVLTVFADGKFRPNAPVSRAEFVNWCYNAVMAQSVPGPDPFVAPKRAFNKTEATGEEFTDVPVEHWAANVLASVHGQGLIPHKTFRPDEPLTREEWAQFASAFGATKAQREAMAKTPDAKQLQVAYRARNFTDFAALKEPMKPYVFFVFADETRQKWLDEAFTLPEAPGPWQPAKPVTRGEAAAWIGGVYDQIGKDIF